MWNVFYLNHTVYCYTHVIYGVIILLSQSGHHRGRFIIFGGRSAHLAHHVHQSPINLNQSKVCNNVFRKLCNEPMNCTASRMFVSRCLPSCKLDIRNRCTAAWRITLSQEVQYSNILWIVYVNMYIWRTHHYYIITCGIFFSMLYSGIKF